MEKPTEEKSSLKTGDESWDLQETIEASSKNGEEGIPSSENSVPDPPNADESVGYNNAEHEFDHGFKAWTQVVGAFFLVFNSSLVLPCLASP